MARILIRGCFSITELYMFVVAENLPNLNLDIQKYIVGFSGESSYLTKHFFEDFEYLREQAPDFILFDFGVEDLIIAPGSAAYLARRIRQQLYHIQEILPTHPTIIFLEQKPKYVETVNDRLLEDLSIFNSELSRPLEYPRKYTFYLMRTIKSDYLYSPGYFNQRGLRKYYRLVRGAIIQHAADFRRD